MERYGAAKQATADHVIRRMRFASWISKERTDTHSEYVVFIVVFHDNNTRTCLSVNFTRTLLVVLTLISILLSRLNLEFPTTSLLQFTHLEFLVYFPFPSCLPHAVPT